MPNGLRCVLRVHSMSLIFLSKKLLPSRVRWHDNIARPLSCPGLIGPYRALLAQFTLPYVLLGTINMEFSLLFLTQASFASKNGAGILFATRI